MNALEFLIALRRRWRVIAIITAATIAIVWITTPSATQKVEVRQYEAGQKLGTRSQVRLSSQWDVLALKGTYGAVPRTVSLHLDAAVQPNISTDQKTAKGAKQSVIYVLGEDRAKLVITPDPTTSSLSIVVTSTNRDLAKNVADDTSATLIAEVDRGYRKDFLDSITTLTGRYNGYLTEQRAAERKKNSCAVGDIRCVQSAQFEVRSAIGQATEMRRQINQSRNLGRKRVDLVPLNEDANNQPSAQSRVLPPIKSTGLPKSAKVRLPIGLGLGLLLGVLGAFLISRFDSAVYGIPATEAAARLPVLAEIPHVTSTRRRRFEVLTQLSPLSGVADAYRGLRTSIGLMWLANESESGQNEPRTLLVASPGPNEGKSTTSANLAAAYAEIGKRVIVVDLDFRRQRLHRFLGANAEPYLQNNGSLSNPIIDLPSVIQQTSIPGVQFIGSASPDSTPAEAAVAGRAAILAACEIADIVIIDTPPLLLTNDTFDLLDLSDAVVLLARSYPKRGPWWRAG